MAERLAPVGWLALASAALAVPSRSEPFVGPPPVPGKGSCFQDTVWEDDAELATESELAGEHLSPFDLRWLDDALRSGSMSVSALRHIPPPADFPFPNLVGPTPEFYVLPSEPCMLGHTVESGPPHGAVRYATWLLSERCEADAAVFDMDVRPPSGSQLAATWMRGESACMLRDGRPTLVGVTRALHDGQCTVIARDAASGDVLVAEGVDCGPMWTDF